MPYLVRHAHAGVKHAWTGPDCLRPLSGPGRREAHGLLTQLRDYQIARILSSPAVRCLQSVEPLARRRGLAVESVDRLGVEADTAGLVALLLDPVFAEAVVCSHGELIGAAFERLATGGLDATADWVYCMSEEVRMRDNPFAEVEPRRGSAPGSVPGTGLGRQVGSTEANPGRSGSGWRFGYAGADRSFAAVAGLVVLVGLVVWLLTSILN